MAQFPVDPVQAMAAITIPRSPTPEERAYNRSVSAAVETLNSAGYAGEGREVTFSMDRASKRPVIRVIDTSTNEVLHQWPPEYLLELAAETRRSLQNSR